MKTSLVVGALTIVTLEAQTLRDSGAQRGVLMGAAVDTAYLSGDANYASTAAQQYSMIEAENEMKWATIRAHSRCLQFRSRGIF
jgi:GH35 family endo-1,4-beta-xylanase